MVPPLLSTKRPKSQQNAIVEFLGSGWLHGIFNFGTDQGACQLKNHPVEFDNVLSFKEDQSLSLLCPDFNC